jgi:hypothetical protein
MKVARIHGNNVEHRPGVLVIRAKSASRRSGRSDGGSRERVALTTVLDDDFARTRSNSTESSDCRAWTSITDRELEVIATLSIRSTSDGRESGADGVCCSLMNGFLISS